MNLIVIPTFNTTEENFNNILTLKNKFPTDTVYVVDNSKNQNDFEHHFIKNNILYEKSIFGGRYEPGALLQAYQKFDADTYLLIQDSIFVDDEIFIREYFEKDLDLIVAFEFLYPSYWFLTHENFDFINSIFMDADDLLDNVFAFNHSSFLCRKKHLDFIVQCGVLSSQFLPINKCQQQAWERIFGIVFGMSGHKLIALNCKGAKLTEEQTKWVKENWIVQLNNPLSKYFIKKHGARA